MGLKKKVHFEFGTKSMAGIMATIGIVMCYVAKTETLVNAGVQTIIDTLGSTFISAGIVSIVLEISTIRKCVESAILDLIRGEVLLEGLSVEAANKVHQKTIEARCGGDLSFGEIKNTAYWLEPYLFEEIKDIYFESHECKYIVCPKEDRIEKNVDLHVIICNKHHKENKFGLTWGFKLRSGVTKDNVGETCIAIQSFKINNVDRTNEAKQSLTVSGLDGGQDIYDEYPFNVHFNWDFGTQERVDVSLKYKYHVEVYDLAQSFKLSTPCKKFRHEVYIEGEHIDEWGLSVNAFSSFYHDKHPMKDFCRVDKMTSKACQVSFDAWTLPGAGYLVAFYKK